MTVRTIALKSIKYADARLAWMLPIVGWTSAGDPKSVEFNQCIVRLAIGSLNVVVVLLIGAFSPLPHVLWYWAVIFFSIAIAHALWVKHFQEGIRLRRLVVLLLDNLTTSFLASFGGPFVPFIAVHFWTTIGYGLRFGMNYLLVASALSIGSVVYNGMAAPFWISNSPLAITIIASLFAITASTAVVLRRIEAVSRELAIQNIRVEQLARNDALTGLANRRALEEALATALAHSQRARQPLRVILFDLDGFKAINDQLGHEAGDTVLKEVARRVGQGLRATDVFARIGGDEYVIVVGNPSDVSGMSRLVEHVLETVRGIDHVGSSAIRVRASVGVGVAPKDRPIAYEDLLRAADQAMYQAKRSGGDQACFEQLPEQCPHDTRDDAGVEGRRQFPFLVTGPGGFLRRDDDGAATGPPAPSVAAAM